MTHHEPKIDDTLSRLLAEPPRGEVQAAATRVLTRLRAERRMGVHSPAPAAESTQFAPHPESSFLPRTVAAALVVAAALGIAVVWPRGVRVYAAGNASAKTMRLI